MNQGKTEDEDECSLNHVRDLFRRSAPLAIAIDSNFFFQNRDDGASRGSDKRISLKQKWLGQLVSLLKANTGLTFVIPAVWET